MKDELGGQIMNKFVWLKSKSYSYLINDSSEDKKEKRQQKKICHQEKISTGTL